MTVLALCRILALNHRSELDSSELDSAIERSVLSFVYD